jgi:plasmid stabilization system protein ParE
MDDIDRTISQTERAIGELERALQGLGVKEPDIGEARNLLHRYRTILEQMLAHRALIMRHTKLH